MLLLDSGEMRAIPYRLWTLAAVSGVLQALPFAIGGPVPAWRRGFCWIALLPLLLALLGEDRAGRSLRPLQAAVLGYSSGVLWYLLNCYWIYQTMYLYGGLPKPVALGILVLFSLYLGLYHAVFAWLVGLSRKWAGNRQTLLGVPFLWVALELARARVTGFPWDLLGYAEVDNLLLTRLAPVAGVMILSFAIVVVNSLFAAAWVDPKPRARWPLSISAICLVALVWAGGRLPVAADSATHQATLLQENLAVGATGRDVEALSAAQKFKVFRALSEHARWISAGAPLVSKPDFVVWPEAPADFVSSDPVFRGELSELARSTNTTVIAGSVGLDFDQSAEGGYREFGSASIFDRRGDYVGRYDKIHRVPWGEYVPYKELFFFAGKLVAGVGRMDAGTEHKIFSTGGHGFGVFICYESIFGDEVREFAKNGAEVLVNISDDGWYGDTGAPWQHLDMARMRAIENRRWILRDTNTGVTAAIDPHGRGVFTTPRHVREAFAFPFNYRSDTTFYTRHGDWFAWVCVGAWALLMGLGFVQRREVH